MRKILLYAAVLCALCSNAAAHGSDEIRPVLTNFQAGMKLFTTIIEMMRDKTCPTKPDAEQLYCRIDFMFPLVVADGVLAAKAAAELREAPVGKREKAEVDSSTNRRLDDFWNALDGLSKKYFSDH